MKVVMLIAIAAIVVSNVGADDGTGFRYMPIETYSRGASITVASVQDFLVRAREQKVDTLYVEVIKGSGGRQQTTHMVFVSAGVFYVLDGHNYQTVADLLRGDNLGFVDGLEYYDAMRRGFADKAEYEREAGRGFLTRADRLDAEKNGFLEPTTRMEMIPYPRTVAVRIFEELLARAYFWRWVESGAAVRRDGPAFGPLSAGGWLEPDAGRGITTGNPAARIRSGLSVLEKERLVNAVVGVWLNATAGGSEPTRGDRYQVDDPPYVKEGDNYVFKGRERVFPSRPRQDSGSAQGRLFVGSTPATGDAMIYYFAKASDCRTYAGFAALSDAVAKGFESAEDAAKANSRGFRSAYDYYGAVGAGFGEPADYELAKRLNIAKYEEYAPIKATLDSLRAINSRYRTSRLRDAAIVLVLERLESGRTVSLQRVADDVNSLVRQYDALKRVDASFGVVTPEAVRAFLNTNGSSIVTIGTFSSQDLVFRRN